MQDPIRRGLPRSEGGEPWPPVASQPAQEQTTQQSPAPAPVEQQTPTGTTAAETEKSNLKWWITGAIGLVILAVVAVAVARWIVSTPWGAQFIERYDGEQPLPDNAPVGHPAWMGWAHFFNMFLMLLIIKSGITWHNEGRPTVFRSPKNNPDKVLPLTLWFHLTVDFLWVILGLIFYILLFSTGQWMRIVPTSWETIPNAVSAGLQYLSLDWPTENGWVHYNSLQELAYFWVVFVAAPLSIFSGLRLSWEWPKKLEFVPRKLAEAIHFPNMIFFVGFIIVHVFLVFTTGMRRNLNGMFAGRGDVDPSVYAQDWTGTIIFLLALVVMLVAWFGLRRPTMAYLARINGTVTSKR